jgi:hypothetical protein
LPRDCIKTGFNRRFGVDDVDETAKNNDEVKHVPSVAEVILHVQSKNTNDCNCSFVSKTLSYFSAKMRR